MLRRLHALGKSARRGRLSVGAPIVLRGLTGVALVRFQGNPPGPRDKPQCAQCPTYSFD